MEYTVYVTVECENDPQRWIAFQNGSLKTSHCLQIGMGYLIGDFLRCRIIGMEYQEAHGDEPEAMEVNMKSDWPNEDDFAKLKDRLSVCGWDFIEGRWGEDYIV